MHWIVIPFRGPDGAKSRLSGVLDEARRTQLALAMFKHVVAVATVALDPRRVLIVTTSAAAADIAQAGGAIALRESSGALNGALRAARDFLLLSGARRATILPADLPQLSQADVCAMLALQPGQVVVAPDRHGSGTNGLAVPLDVDFEFFFGSGSLARHVQEASRLGLEVTRVSRSGLACDLDTGDDLDLLPHDHWLRTVIARPRAA
jgi:2-phospho-L-lactate guanylyltransferase